MFFIELMNFAKSKQVKEGLFLLFCNEMLSTPNGNETKTIIKSLNLFEFELFAPQTLTTFAFILEKIGKVYFYLLFLLIIKIFKSILFFMKKYLQLFFLKTNKPCLYSLEFVVKN